MNRLGKIVNKDRVRMDGISKYFEKAKISVILFVWSACVCMCCLYIYRAGMKAP